jgi:hypothetical protein
MVDTQMTDCRVTIPQAIPETALLVMQAHSVPGMLRRNDMDTEHQATLASLQDEFPAFSITMEPALSGPRYIARSRRFGQNPHTLVTPDPAELRTALIAAQIPQQRS